MAEKDSKRFPEWMELKEKVHSMKRTPHFLERQIWWMAVGENVGVEINGKSKTFSRPVLIYRKLGRYGFMGIPMTTQPHSGSWYVGLSFKGKYQYAVLSQARAMSVSRIYGDEPIGRLSVRDFRRVCRGFDELYHFDFKENKNIPQP